MQALSSSDAAYKDKASKFAGYTDFSQVPQPSMDNIVRLAVVVDKIIEEAKLDALALRCWIEMQQVLKISPCVILSELNDRGIIAACEVDVGNAIAMRALSAASGNVAACLDWNNNYEEEEDKCILFHCGPVAQSMMVEKGKVTGHAILENAVGPNCSYGCNQGRIHSTEFTFSSMMTEDGGLRFYAGEGRFTKDPIPPEFFGCAGVAEIPNLQDVLLYVGMQGHRHHVSVTPGSVCGPLTEALEYYLGHEVAIPQDVA
jgi:L-fucose isomerase-like protein